MLVGVAPSLLHSPLPSLEHRHFTYLTYTLIYRELNAYCKLCIFLEIPEIHSTVSNFTVKVKRLDNTLSIVTSETKVKLEAPWGRFVSIVTWDLNHCHIPDSRGFRLLKVERQGRAIFKGGIRSINVNWKIGMLKRFSKNQPECGKK